MRSGKEGINDTTSSQYGVKMYVQNTGKLAESSGTTGPGAWTGTVTVTWDSLVQFH